MAINNQIIASFPRITTADTNGNILSLQLSSNVGANAVLTDNLLFANGQPWNFATGTYSNANVANYLPTYTGNFTANNANFSGQVYIASNTIIGGNLRVVGNITALNFTELDVGNIQIVLAANANVASDAANAGIVINGANINFLYNYLANTMVLSHAFQSNGNITTQQYFIGNGAFLTGLSTYSNANVANYLPTYNGNIQLSNANITRSLTIGNVANVFIGNGSPNLFLTTNGNGSARWAKATVDVFGNFISAAPFTLSGGSGNGAPGFSVFDNTLTANISNTFHVGDRIFMAGNVGDVYTITSIDAPVTYSGTFTISPNLRTAYAFGSNIFVSLAQPANSIIVAGQGNITYNNGQATINIFSQGGNANINYSNANVANYLPVYSGNVGNGAGYIFGNGAFLTGIQASSSYSNANVANYLPIYTGNVNAAYYTGNGRLLTDTTIRYAQGNISNSGYQFWQAGIETNSQAFLGDGWNRTYGIPTYTVLTLEATLTAGSDQFVLTGDQTATLNSGYSIQFNNTGNYYLILDSNYDSGTNQTTVYLPIVDVTFNIGAQIYRVTTTQTTAKIPVGSTFYISPVGGTLYTVLSVDPWQANSFPDITNYTLTTNMPAHGNVYIYPGSGYSQTPITTLQLANLTGIVDGELLTIQANLATTDYSNANVANYLPVYGGNVGNGAGYVFGNGSFLTGLPATYSNANVANYLPTYTGNIAAGNAIVGNTVYANLFVGTFQGNITGNLVVPGINTQVLFNDSGNANANSGFTFNKATGVVAVTGNVSANYFLGNGSQLTGIVANLTNYNSNASFSNVTVTRSLTVGNVANVFIGNGAPNLFLTTASNGSAQWSKSTVDVFGGFTSGAPFIVGGGAGLGAPGFSVYDPAFTANIANTFRIGDRIYLGGNVTDIYTIANIDLPVPQSGTFYVSPNLRVGYALGSNIFVSTTQAANTLVVTGQGLVSISNGQATINILTQSGTYSNANVANYLPTYSGNISAGNANITGNVSANYFLGNGAFLTGITGSNTDPQTYTYRSDITFPSTYLLNSVAGRFMGAPTADRTIQANLIVPFNSTDGYPTNGWQLANVGNATLSGGTYTFSISDPLVIFDVAGQFNITEAQWGAGNTVAGGELNIRPVANLAAGTYPVRVSYVVNLGPSLQSVTQVNGNSNSNISLTGANISLGNVANVKIYNGTTGQLLSTDGTGNLSWVDGVLPGIGWSVTVAPGFDTTGGSYVGWSGATQFPVFYANGQVLATSGFTSSTYLGATRNWPTDNAQSMQLFADLYYQWHNSVPGALQVSTTPVDTFRFTINTQPLATGINPTQSNAVVQNLFNLTNPNAGPEFVNSLQYDDASGLYPFQRAKGGAVVYTENLQQVLQAGNVANLGFTLTNSANITTSGNISANYFLGNGSQLTGLPGGSSLVNGNSNVVVAANGNVSISVGGVPNIAVFTSSNVFLTNSVISNTLFLTPAIVTGNHNTGTVAYSNVDDTLVFYTSVNDAPIHPGREVTFTGYNQTGATITSGSVVYITGTHGQQPQIALANAQAIATAAAVGVVQYDIPNNANGIVTTVGEVGKFNTQTYTAGQTLYLDPATPGGVTTTIPTTPNVAIRVGFVEYVNPSNGKIYVSIRNAYTFANTIVGLDTYTGNIQAGNLVVTANATVQGNLRANGNSYFTSNVYITGNANAGNFIGTLANGNSNIAIAGNGNIDLNMTTTSNINLAGNVVFSNVGNIWIPNPVVGSALIANTSGNLAWSPIVHYFPGVYVATTANLIATYNNGTLGVGATLTNSGTLTALVIDTVSVSAGQRVLVKDQTTQAYNGIYTVTTAGSGAVAWVLTRATDYDQPQEMLGNDLFTVQAGAVNAAAVFVQTNRIITVGTTNVIFDSSGVLTLQNAVAAGNTSSLSILISNVAVPNANNTGGALQIVGGISVGNSASNTATSIFGGNVTFVNNVITNTNIFATGNVTANSYVNIGNSGSASNVLSIIGRGATTPNGQALYNIFSTPAQEFRFVSSNSTAILTFGFGDPSGLITAATTGLQVRPTGVANVRILPTSGSGVTNANLLLEAQSAGNVILVSNTAIGTTAGTTPLYAANTFTGTVTLTEGSNNFVLMSSGTARTPRWSNRGTIGVVTLGNVAGVSLAGGAGTFTPATHLLQAATNENEIGLSVNASGQITVPAGRYKIDIMVQIATNPSANAVMFAKMSNSASITTATAYLNGVAGSGIKNPLFATGDSWGISGTGIYDTAVSGTVLQFTYYQTSSGFASALLYSSWAIFTRIS